MKGTKGLARVLLYFFMLLFIIYSFSCSGGGDGNGDNNNDNNDSISQVDLEGTWYIQRLEAGSTDAWGRYNVTIGSTGTLTFNSCRESSGSTTCPSNTMVWTIDEDTGVITETENGTATDAHFSIASNGKFIAGTSSGSSQLFIAQKMVSGTTYSASDVQSKSWVFHELSTGANPRWSYGNGTIAANGAMTITSETDPSGTDTPGATGVTIAVNTNGVVTMTGGPGAESLATYQGFLSDDKKTIVGTYTDSDDEYRLLIIQITTGQTGNSTSQIAGTARNHTLQVGVSPAPFWEHFTVNTTSTGAMTYSNWVSQNNVSSAPSGTRTISISSTGVATVANNPSFHGQLSYDRTFMVATESRGTGIYGMHVIVLTHAADGSSSSSSSSSSTSSTSSSTGSSSTGSSSTGSSSTSSSSTSSSTGSSSTGSSSTGSSSTGSTSSSTSSTSSSSSSSSTGSSSGGGVTEVWKGTFERTFEDTDPLFECSHTYSGNITITLTRNGTSVSGINVISNFTKQDVSLTPNDGLGCVPSVGQCMIAGTNTIPDGNVIGAVNGDGSYNFSTFYLAGCLGDFTNVLGTVSGTRMTGTKTLTGAEPTTLTFDIVKQ